MNIGGYLKSAAGAALLVAGVLLLMMWLEAGEREDRLLSHCIPHMLHTAAMQDGGHDTQHAVDPNFDVSRHDGRLIVSATMGQPPVPMRCYQTAHGRNATLLVTHIEQSLTPDARVTPAR